MHRLAAAGNAAAVALLVLLLAHGAVLFEPLARDSPPGADRGEDALPAADCSACRGVVLVVLDGLRADTAADARVMPCLGRLADSGGRGVARVEALVPCTIAAVVTFTTGRVPPPVAFLEDFTARPAAAGGLFAAVTASGGRSFVAGPRLWTDLYGRWIQDSETDAGFGDRDGAVFQAGLAAVRSGRYRFVVIHLQGTDAAAHRFGTASAPFIAAARRGDDAIGRLRQDLPADWGLVVTSDHGNVAAGGHAGPESVVLNTPLVTFGPGLSAGPLPPGRQRDVHELLGRALGVAWPVTAGEASRRPWYGAGLPLPAAVLAVWGVLVIGSAVAGAAAGRRQAFALNLAVWITLALVLGGLYRTALLVGAGALAGGALLTHARAAPRVCLALAVGGAVGVGRLAVAWAACQADVPAVGVPALAILCLVGLFAAFRLTGRGRSPRAGGRCRRERLVRGLVLLVGLGFAGALGGAALAAAWVAAHVGGWTLSAHADREGVELDRRTYGTLLGACVIIAHALFTAALGETLSLSTLPVRPAFAVAERLGSAGVAVPLVVLTELLPVLGLLTGLRPALVRSSPEQAGSFAAGMAAAATGQAVPLTLLPYAAPGQVPTALGLDGLLRIGCEITVLFLAAGVLWLTGSRRARSGSPAG